MGLKKAHAFDGTCRGEDLIASLLQIRFIQSKNIWVVLDREDLVSAILSSRLEHGSCLLTHNSCDFHANC